MTRRLPLSGPVALALFAPFAPSTRAQSINVDFEPAGGPYGVPSPTYGASNGLPGVWNSVSSLSVSNLRRWDGTPTNVSLSCTSNDPDCVNGARFIAYDNLGTAGDDQALLDDVNIGGNWDDNSVIWKFEGLAPGTYVVDTIVHFTACAYTDMVVAVYGAAEGDQFVRSVWGGAFVQGSTTWPSPPGSNFARHTATVTTGELYVVVYSSNPYLTGTMTLCGIQLNANDRDITGTQLCAGDGTDATCPCVNPGQTGIGCQNSAGTGGSWLHASGSSVPDTLVLHASGELPNALSIFLQGNVVIPAVPYGDGLRCAGGTLRRLYTKSASSGVVFAPGPGDASISAQSANLGVPIVPGGRRYYQVYYRDANAGFCPPPQGNTFNVSNAVKIAW